MRLAMVDYVVPGGGVATWAREVSVALNAELWLWRSEGKTPIGSYGPNAKVMPRRPADKLDILNSYDFVIFVALGTAKAPIPLKVLGGMTRPWAVMAHGGNYAKNTQMVEFFGMSSSDGVIFTSSARQAQPILDAGVSAKVVELPWLPYTPASDCRMPDGEPSEVVMTSRVISTKGCVVLGRMADELKWPLGLYGGSQPLPFGESSSDVFNKLAAIEGFEVLVGPEPPKSAAEWSLRSSGGVGVQYHGMYDPYAIERTMEKAAAHVNLTSAKYTYDHLEYSTLEAIDWGIPAVVTGAQYRADIENLRVWPVNSYISPAKCDPEKLVAVIREAASLGPVEREVLWNINQGLLRDLHSPATYVEKMLKEL